MMWMRFLALVVTLNILRYLLGAAVEPFLIFDGLFGAMAAAKDTFNTSFTTVDWVTSYFYNFMVWFACALVFHMARPALSGRDVSASLRVFGIMWLFFASVSAVYMNHYSHPKDFYLWNIADALLVFAIVAICNGILYRRIMGPYAATNGSEP